MSLESHDKSLKFLLSQEPAAFIAFGLRATSLRVLGPVEGDLPARDRTMDGGYLIERDDQREVCHIEFLRRHESLIELALDVGETQIRLRRKEGAQVYSLVWDLYGSRKGAVVQEVAFYIGRDQDSAGTRVAYLRVNLRAMKAAELLDRAPRTLLPLVPLTSDGAAIGPVRQAAALIEARTDLSPRQKADHLTVLKFLAEKEDVPLKVLEFYFTKEKLMESSFYRSIIEEGEVKGQAKALLQLLIARLGKVPPKVKQIIMQQVGTSPETISEWFSEAALALDAPTARRLVRKITAA